MNIRSLMILFVCVVAVYAQSYDDSTEITEPADTTEATSVLLEKAALELSEVELQIAREEERLERIMAELIQLRRQHAMLANAESAFLLGEELYTAGSIVWAKDAFE